MRRRSKDVLTVEQAAQILGIGRQTAYAQCRLFLATASEGIPCHRIGRLILLYRAELERWLGFPLPWPPEDDPPAERPASADTKPAARSERPTSPRTVRRVATDQTTLPF